MFFSQLEAIDYVKVILMFAVAGLMCFDSWHMITWPKKLQAS